MPIRLALALFAFTLPAAAAEPPPSFAHDVSAVLSRAGCNMGACHGNLNGKGGLKLSLRGEDPAFDFAALTRGAMGRRVDTASPGESLLLKKAVGSVPHEGGVRFPPASEEYAILRKWVAAGCPTDTDTAAKLAKLIVTPTQQILRGSQTSFQFSATAHFADGSTRDVTTLVAIETTTLGVVKVLPSGEVQKEQDGETVILVRYLGQQVPVRVAFIPDSPVPDVSVLKSNNRIDALVAKQLLELRIPPSGLCADEVFIRRASLDACGTLPTADAVRKFLADKSPNKREKLIDALLARPEFAEYWAMKWSDLLRNEEKSLDKKGVQVYHRWIKDWFAADRPLNEFAREILSARGSTYENPPTNFYRAVRDPQARAEAVAQVFLGVRVSCAKCHNHPFDRWTQDDYHRFAAFFPRVQYRLLNNSRKDDLDKHEFIGEQVVFTARSGETTLPRTGGVAVPKTLGDDRSPKDDDDRLGMLAEWIAAPDNPFFAKAQANRVWFHLLGRGLVEPDDDFKVANPPSNAELLDHLAAAFKAGGFRLKPFVKTILLSRTYQLSSSTNDRNSTDSTHFSHALIQPLEAEQLLDGVSRVFGVNPQFAGYPSGMRAGAVPAMSQAGTGGRRGAASMSERFLRVFGKPERLLTCDCERSEEAGLLQAFQMINGEQINAMLRRDDNRIGKLLDQKLTDEEVLDELYLAALSRFPTELEKSKLLDYVQSKKDRRTGWEDVTWGLVNAKEFLLRR
ncbi:DUF1549 and DUF1553 domain-containing protein [Limnoglobus roseus]|uniref:DUF1549 domain-containing protein n=1 Tax=Limnoglobus roseus TaxID=2598579 RepID=A0A5C1ADP0_9BACT|nr:DUF1549 and DUF1553 domain-containing protein [Limnoglobus roseus]QEL15178.1 hypothetical protein PX52LOC_02093 [Limnoglobus roseus]